MPVSPNPEASAIEDAYAEQLKKLYSVFVSNLVDAGAGGEQKSIERFTAGVNVSRRAKDLALVVLSKSSPAMGPSLARVEHGMVQAGAPFEETA